MWCNSLDFNFVTKLYIKNIKDEHWIIFQGTKNEVGFSSKQRFNYFGVWCPTDFNALRLNTLWLKIKT